MSEEDLVRGILGFAMLSWIVGTIIWDAKTERRKRKMREEAKDE
jgi:hypothetical protein